jgi:hypothetical protein
MSFQDKYGITSIPQRERGAVDVFDISWDQDDENSPKLPVFLMVPDKNSEYHEHIELTRRGAMVLREWLEDYLRETSRFNLDKVNPERIKW